MRKIRIQMNDIRESIPVKDGYYMLLVIGNDKLVPSELCGGTFYKLEGLAGGVATGIIDMLEIYEQENILAWGRIPEEY